MTKRNACDMDFENNTTDLKRQAYDIVDMDIDYAQNWVKKEGWNDVISDGFYSWMHDEQRRILSLSE
jgi:hypothetical protein